MALYKLVEAAAHEREVALSTGTVAKVLGLSQQTASRRLIDMEKQGLIARTGEGRVQRIRITKEGLSSLTEMYRVLKHVFEAPKRELVMKAVVFSGLSEGSYYMSMEGYRRQFKSKLDLDPFPGTQNLRVSHESLSQRRELDSYHSWTSRDSR